MPPTPNTKIHGFTVTRVTPLPTQRATAIECEHDRSGARVLHLHCDDPECLLAIALRTPPPDDTGLTHILEHTVLCGSKRYPVKDPFVELLRTSLATFLNAMTGSDYTVYPCASSSEKDFFNLASVYCDAVFFPRLDEKHFQQEGCHLAPPEVSNNERPPSPLQSPPRPGVGSPPHASTFRGLNIRGLTFRGIVFNEMKGVFSELSALLGRDVSRALCPDNAYGYESGGKPEAIPDLTYQNFIAYHKRYYHPANARIFLFGRIDTAKQLEFLDRVCLSKFTRITVDSSIAPQPRWDTPRKFERTYPIGEHEDPRDRAAVAMSWLTNDATDEATTLAMNILESVLLGHSGSPMRKALIDSKLGQELTGSGYGDNHRDTYFTVGLKGTRPERADAIEKLVFDTLKQLVTQGLEPQAVASAIHRYEIAAREIGSSYALRMMGRVTHAWLYDTDPLSPLRLDEQLAAFKTRLADEPRYLESLIQRWLLDNPHRATFVYTPDRQYAARKAKEEQARLDRIASDLTDEQYRALADKAAQLDAMQSAPNTPEALATLPRLQLEDVPPDPVELDTTLTLAHGHELLVTDMFSNGLNYLTLAFDLSGLDDGLFDYLPLYTSLLTQMGAAGQDYATLAKRQAGCAGGVSASLSVGLVHDGSNSVEQSLRIWASALDAKLPDMLDLVHDRLLEGDLDDLARMHDVIKQDRIALRSGIVPGGSGFAGGHAARRLSTVAQRRQRLGGIRQLRLHDDLADHFDQRREITEKLAQIRDYLRSGARLTASFVGHDTNIKRIKQFLARMPRTSVNPVATLIEEPHRNGHPLPPEALTASAQVAFVARSHPGVGVSDPLAPALHMLSVQLSYGYLWEQVRVKGGAYGCKASLDTTTRTFSLASYRDPHVAQTLAVYDRLHGHVQREMDLSPDAMRSAIIGTVKTLDAPIRPPSAASVALSRHLARSTAELRTTYRHRLLSLEADTVRQAGDKVFNAGVSSVCVLAGRDKIDSVTNNGGWVVENL